MVPMKVGMIGVGGFAGGTHVPNVAANPNFELAALCDLNEQRLKELAAKYKSGYTTTDMQRIFKDPAIEMIVCGTKPAFRLPIMRAAVEHRKHLFVEKPMCYTAEDLRVMVPLMRKAPIKFMVGFNRPYSPMMQALKPIYRRHLVPEGKMQNAECRMQKEEGGNRTTKDPALPEQMSALKPINQRQKEGGNTTIIYRIIGEAQMWPPQVFNAVVHQKESTIIHEVTHIFDLLNWITDLKPTRVYTAGGGNMDNVITLTYPDNVTAVVISGDNASTAFPKERIEIDTNHGTIVGESFVELQTAGIEGAAQRQTFPYSQQGKTCDNGVAGYFDRLWAWRRKVTAEERAYGYYYERMPLADKGHYNELDFFRKIIQADQPSQTDVIGGAAAELIALAAIESWKTGQPKDLDFKYLERL